jgi:hypothetical protein
VFLKFRAKALERGWRYDEISASHDAMVTAVHETHMVLRRAVR